MKNFLTGIFLCSFLISSRAQTTFNAELQVYPTGIIPGVRIENRIKPDLDIHLRLGMNIFNHRDLGVHDEETGQGFGFTLGVSKVLNNSKFSLGLRNDVWFNKVDWSDGVSPSKVMGETSITVIQPTAELNYRIATKQLLIRPSLSFGLEWNVVTKGEPTGEGPIILIGVIVGKL